VAFGIRKVGNVNNQDDTGKWQYDSGVVTRLIPRMTDIRPEKTFVTVCGPPVMYKFVVDELLKLHLPKHQLLMTLERTMKCGIGKCGHCIIGGYIYTCTEGPVFTYWDVIQMKGLILYRRMKLDNDKCNIGLNGLTGCNGDQLIIIHSEDKILDFFQSANIKSFSLAKSDNDESELDIAFKAHGSLRRLCKARCHEKAQASRAESVPFETAHIATRLCVAWKRPWASRFRSRHTICAH
jgi:hypothetical protein